MYVIHQLMPRTDISVGRHGFAIELPECWPELVRRSGIDDSKAQYFLRNNQQAYLNAIGMKGERRIRMDWGEWGIHHLDVPGNACSLDLERDTLGMYLRGGAILTPHNIDTFTQKMLLLLVFCELAEFVVCLSKVDRVSAVFEGDKNEICSSP